LYHFKESKDALYASVVFKLQRTLFLEFGLENRNSPPLVGTEISLAFVSKHTTTSALILFVSAPVLPAYLTHILIQFFRIYLDYM
jgi:hypothetical protein